MKKKHLTKLAQFFLPFIILILTVNIVNAQSNPVAVDDTASIRKFYREWINVLNNDYDPNGDEITVLDADDPAVGDLSGTNDTAIRYRNNVSVGWDSLMYRIIKTDQPEYMDSAWLFIEVLPNELPIVNPDTVSLMVGDTLIINVFDHAWDPDGDEFELYRAYDPEHGEAQKISDSTFWVIITNNYQGLDSTEVRLDETGSGQSSYGFIFLDVDINPEYPIALNDTIDAFQGDTIYFPVLDNDYDLQSDQLVLYDVDRDYSCEYFSYNDSLVIIVPHADANPGLYRYFDYYAREEFNPLHVSNQADGYLNIIENPNLPQAVNDTVTATAGLPIEIPVLLNDYDINGDSLIIEYAGISSAYGFVEHTDSLVLLSPYCFLIEDFTLSYRIIEKQNSAHFAWANIVVHVIENNNQPIAIADTIYIHSYDSTAFFPVQNDYLPYQEDVSVQHSFIGVPSYGTFTISVDSIETSKVKAKLNANFSGMIPVQYRFNYVDNPAMISNYGTLYFVTEPNPDSALAVDDEMTVTSYNADSLYLLANDINLHNEDFIIKRIETGSGFDILEYNDSIFLAQASPLLSGQHSFRYYIDKSSSEPPYGSFATIKITVPETHQADSLYVNHINAGFTAYGMNFWDQETENDVIKFEVPKGSGKQTIFSNTTWIGGIQEDTLYLAGERYRAGGGKDFWPGPVSDQYPTEDLMKYGVWKINISDIENHISHYQDPGYEPIEAIKSWPGNGNVSLGQAAQLAPYYDLDKNDIYDPYAGDFPLIRGDQSLYFIFNDAKDIHTESEGNNLNVEIHGNAYAYDQPDDSALFNTIFVHYDIYNRSGRTYSDTYLGLFVDLDLGYAWDDHIGCDVSRGAFYAYNGYPQDGSGEPEAYGHNPPVQSAVILGGVRLASDNTDNPAGGCDASINGLNFGDGIVDNERMGMTGFSYFNNTSSNPNTTDPQIASQYYNFLKGLWKDSSPMLYGGSAHYMDPQTVGPECKFMFPGASDPLNWGTGCVYPNGGFNQNGYYWNEETIGNIPGDRRGLGITGPFNFAPGEVQSLDVAYVYARDNDTTDNITAIDIMNQRIDTLRNRVMRGEIIYLPEYSVGIAENDPVSFEVSVYPNPSGGGQVFVDLRKSGLTGTATYRISDLLGRTLSRGILKADQVNSISTANLDSGIYLLAIESENRRALQKLVIRE